MLGIVSAALLALPGSGSAEETAAPFWQGFAYLGTTPALLAGIAAVLLVVTAAPRRRLSALIMAVALLIGLGVYRLGTQHLAVGSCTPSVPTGVVDPPDARLSYRSRVFISAQATADQRNLAQAAIGRGFGGGLTFDGDPRSSGFTDAFCGHGRVSAEVADTLPRYWTVDLASPGLFAGLAAEVSVMPGMVAVHHVRG